MIIVRTEIENMQAVDELKQLRDKVVGIEMHLSLLQSDLSAVARDIAFLEDLATVLRENKEVLKSDKVIAVAAEYKRVVAELKTVEANLIYYYNLQRQLSGDLVRFTTLKETTIIEFESLRAQLDARKVILLFDLAKRKT